MNYITDIKTRFIYLMELLKSKNFIISIIILISFYQVNIYIEISILNSIIIIPLYILMMIVVYDLILSYILFNINTFDPRRSIISYIIGELDLNDCIAQEIPSLEDIPILERIDEKLEQKLDELTSNITIQRIFTILYIKLIKILILILSKIVIIYNFNSFLHKTRQLFRYLLKIILRLVMNLLKDLLKIIWGSILIVIIIFIALIVFGSLHKAGSPLGGIFNLIEIFNLIDIFNPLNLFYFFDRGEVIKGGLNVIFTVFLCKLLIPWIKKIIIIVGLILVLYIIYYLAYKSLILFDITDYIFKYLYPLFSNTYSFSNTDSLMVATHTDILFFILIFIYLLIFLCGKKFKGVIFEIIIFIYAIFFNIFLLIFSFFTSSYLWVFIALILFIWNMKSRLEAKLSHSLILILISHLPILPLEQINFFQICFTFFIFITNSECSFNDQNEIFFIKDIYIKSLKGKYKDLLNKVIDRARRLSS